MTNDCVASLANPSRTFRQKTLSLMPLDYHSMFSRMATGTLPDESYRELVGQLTTTKAEALFYQQFGICPGL
jgi:hypothetical protein